MVEPIAVGRDVLLSDRESGRELPGRDAHNVEEVFGNAQDIAVEHRGRDGNAVVADDLIAFGRVDRQNGIHCRVNFFLIENVHRHRRIHERSGLVRQRRRIRTNVSAYDHVAFEFITAHRHAGELGCNG